MPAPLARHLPQSGASSKRREGKIGHDGETRCQGLAIQVGHFLVEVEPVFWQCSRMERGYARDTHHTVSAGILDALGRGFLIATAGVMAGLMFGTAPMASLAMWTVGVAAASGVACTIGSALVRNAGLDGCGQEANESPPLAEAGKCMATTPTVDAAVDIAPEESQARRRVMASRERGQSLGRNV